MPDLNRLRHAVAIAREGSYSAAAIAIPLSQPALTRSIQSLEREYDVTLFDRGKTGTRLTPEGVQFVAQAERLLHHAEAVDDELRSAAAGRGALVSFGLGPVSASCFLPEVLPMFASTGDGIRVRIQVGSNSMLRDLLRSGEIDFYIGGVPRDSDNFTVASGVRTKRIGNLSQLALLVREDHPLLAVPLSADTLSQYPVAAGTFVRDTLKGTDLDALGIRTPTIEMDDYELLAGLVRSSDVILVASSVLSRQRPNLGLVRLPLEVAQDRHSIYTLVSSSERKLSAAAEAVVRRLLEVIGSSFDG
ncbi:LysR family transcriptional regulator [Arthrobacter sp. KNU-44]|uniref:LysR family transcriptional regulator n=1 Tax=Arthrobacter sp. KNU-44 TaxID=3450744 RepID=UPI003F41FCC8